MGAENMLPPHYLMGECGHSGWGVFTGKDVQGNPF